MYVRVLSDFCKQYASKESGGKPGFDSGKSYKVHKIESYSDTGAGYVVLVNDLREIWWVDNRHVRVTCEELDAFGSEPLEMPLQSAGPYMA